MFHLFGSQHEDGPLALQYVPHSRSERHRPLVHPTAFVLLIAVGIGLSAGPVQAQPTGAITPPALLAQPAVDLPAGWTEQFDWRRGLVVELIIVISTEGTVTSVEVADGPGEPIDSAVAEAAQAMRFEPALQGELPIAVKVPFAYRIEADPRRGPFGALRRTRRAVEQPAGQRVKGQLLAKGTRAPLVDVLVQVVDDNGVMVWQGTTNEKGRFDSEPLPPGPALLEIAEGEFEGKTRAIIVKPSAEAEDAIDTDTLYLRAVRPGEFSTTVQQKREPDAATQVVLTGPELTRTPGTFGDPTRVVATLPGVARSPFGLGFYLVRGAAFDNTGFFIDDHPALYLYHLVGGPAVIHPELVGELSFYPGGYPAEYGRYAAGIIALDSKEPPVDRWHLDIEVDVLKASSLFSIPFDDGRGVFTVAFRRSYYELLVPLFTDGVEISYTDYQLRVAWSPIPDLRLKLFVLGAEDLVDISTGGSDSSTNANLGFHRASLSASWDIQPDLTWSSSVFFEYQHTQGRNASEENDTLSADLDAFVFQLRSALQMRASKWVTLTGGLDFLVNDTSADLRIPSVPPLGDPDPPQFDPVVIPVSLNGLYLSGVPFLMADIEPVKDLHLIPGVRFNFDEYGDQIRTTVDPKLTVRWGFAEGWTAKGSLALSHQAPQVFQVEVPYGDPSIPPLRALQTSAGLEWSPIDELFISVEGFYNEFSNFVRANNVVTNEDGSLAQTNFSADIPGRSYGLEVLVRKPVGGRWYGWLSYTLSRTERRFPDDGWVLGAFDQSHVLNLAAGVNLGDGWRLGGRFTLTSGTPYYPVVGSRYDADRDEYVPLFAESQSRLPFFHRLDIRLDKDFYFDQWIFGFYIDIQNVYNSPNPESPRYSYDFTIRTDGAGVPILPTLGVRARF